MADDSQLWSDFYECPGCGYKDYHIMPSLATGKCPGCKSTDLKPRRMQVIDVLRILQRKEKGDNDDALKSVKPKVVVPPIVTPVKPPPMVPPRLL